MKGIRVVLCPKRHLPEGPLVEIAGAGQAMADAAVLAVLSRGECPACPSAKLTARMTRIGDADLPVRRCACCGAAWQHGLDWWAAADLGTLTDA